MNDLSSHFLVSGSAKFGGRAISSSFHRQIMQRWPHRRLTLAFYYVAVMQFRIGRLFRLDGAILFTKTTNSSRSLRLFRPLAADGKVNCGSQFVAKNRSGVENW
jgi:hypothetical protein